MDFSTSNLITLGGVFASVIGAWYLLRYQVSELRAADTKQQVELKLMWAKIEDIKERLGLQEQKMSVISGMLRPEAVSEHTVKLTTMQCGIEVLRRDVDELRNK